MKIVNEYVKINIGGKSFSFVNLILDTYLRAIAEHQDLEMFEFMEYWQPPFLNKCFVKFDRKLHFDETSMLSTEDFDVQFDMVNNYVKTSENKNEIEYIYKCSGSLSQYYGERITAVGFFDTTGDVCYACLDLYDYSLKIQEGDDIAIVRKDTFETEALFSSSSAKIPYPIHLLPVTMYYKVSHPELTDEYPFYTNNVSAHLESVGIGTNSKEMKKEFFINSENTRFFGEKIIFKDIFSIENLLGLLEPNFVYPSSSIYPVSTGNNFSYIFMKYKVYYNRYTYPGSVNFEHVDTGEWYTLAIPVKAEGNFNYAITYERSDEYGI